MAKQKIWDTSYPALWILGLSLIAMSNCQNLGCFFRMKMSTPCSNSGGENVPTRLKQLYNGTSDVIKEAITREKLETLSREEILDFPLQIFYLIPPRHFKNIKGLPMASLVKKYPQEISLIRKIVDALQLEVQRKEFIKHLEGVELSDESQSVIAEALTIWYPYTSNWTFNLFTTVKKVGNPLLGHLPPRFLFKIEKDVIKNFLYHLKELNLDEWEKKPWSIRRAWASLMVTASYPKPLKDWKESHFEMFAFILQGALYDELQHLPAMDLAIMNGLNIKLNKLQARSLFNSLFAREKLTTESLKKLLNISLHLAPQDLQKFRINATDFLLLQTLPFEKDVPSLPTAKQVVELLIAQLVMENKLESENPATWHGNITHLGKFVYALPMHALKPYSSVSQSLKVLTAIDSDKFSATQARLIIGNSALQSVLLSTGLLKGIRSSTLSKLAVKDIPQLLLNHLLSHFPGDTRIKSLSLLQKVRTQLSSNSILDNMLFNKNANQFFELLSSWEVSKNLQEIRTVFSNLGQISEATIKNLPQNMMSVLLSDRRQKLTRRNLLWNADNLIHANGVNLTLLGITCNDIRVMDVVDLILIIGKYNRERQTLQKAFPKNLQNCLLEAVVDYLLMKAHLQRRNVADGLLNFLEPFEIDAFGGFICASLPTHVILGSVAFSHILRAIGKLSLPELLVATSGNQPQDYAETFLLDQTNRNATVKNIDTLELLSLGSLVLFLNTSNINKINPEAFKSFWEMVDPKSKALCLSNKDSKAWNDLINRAFGDPRNWTAGVLATLGDLLVTVSSKTLDVIPEASWITAVDTLVEETSYHINVEWPGEVDPIQIVQACLKLLPAQDHNPFQIAILSLQHRYLMATQKLLGQVKSSSQLLAPFHKVVKDTQKLRQVPFDLGQSVLKVIVMTPGNDASQPSTASEEITHMSNTIPSSDATSSAIPVKADTATTGLASKGTTRITTNSSLMSVATVGTVKLNVTLEMNNTTVPAATSSNATVTLFTVNNTRVNNVTVLMTTHAPTESTFKEESLTSGITHQQNEVAEQLNRSTISGRFKRQVINSAGNLSKKSGDGLRASLDHNASRITSDVKTEETTKLPLVRFIGWNNNMSCDAIRATGLPAGLSLHGLDILSIPVQDLRDCIDMLGSLQLPGVVQRVVWQRIAGENIQIDWEDIGHLITSVTLEDAEKIPLNLTLQSALDILAVLGSEPIDAKVLKYLAGKFLVVNGEPIAWPTETIVAMGQLLCKLSKPFLDRLLGRDNVFVEASPALGQIKGCPMQCLSDMARIAIKHTSYGQPSSWTAEDVATLGTIVAGLKHEEWVALKDNGNDPLVGLQPSAIKCISPNVFKTLNEKQISLLPPMTAAMATKDQIFQLSNEQLISLRRSQNQVPRANLSPVGVAYQYPEAQHPTDTSAAVPKTALSMFVLLLVISRRLFLFL